MKNLLVRVLHLLLNNICFLYRVMRYILFLFFVVFGISVSAQRNIVNDGFKMVDGKKVRYAKKSGEEI